MNERKQMLIFVVDRQHIFVVCVIVVAYHRVVNIEHTIQFKLKCNDVTLEKMF